MSHTPSNDRMVRSTDDARTVNNDVRHQYRVLTDEEKRLMTEFKDIGQAFIDKCRNAGASRDLSLAITHMEDAVMRAVRHVTN